MIAKSERLCTEVFHRIGLYVCDTYRPIAHKELSGAAYRCCAVLWRLIGVGVEGKAGGSETMPADGMSSHGAMSQDVLISHVPRQ